MRRSDRWCVLLHGKRIRYYNKGKPTNGIWENGVLVMEND